MTAKKHYHPAPPGWRPEPLKIGQRIYCGAWARSRGRRCKQAPCGPSGRCRMHSGKGDSGPRTAEGKARVAEAQRKAWARLKADMGLPPGWKCTANRVSKGRREREPHTAAAYLAVHGPHKPEEPAT
jgi:hypothetical protein